MYIAAVRIKLRNPLRFYSYARKVLPVFEDMRKARGNIYYGVKSTNFLEHYFKIAWHSEEDWKAYISAQEFKDALQIAEKVSQSFDLCEWRAEAYPTWKELMAKLDHELPHTSES